MADPFILANARRLPMFARLSAAQMEQVASVMQTQRFQTGEELFRQGEIPPGMFMFISGHAVMTQRGADGVERPFGQVRPGEYVTENAMFAETAAPVSVRVMQESIVLFLSRQNMRNLLALHPDIKANVVITRQDVSQAPAKRFEGQRDNETVLLQTRRHIGALVGRIASLIIVTAIVWLGTVLLSSSAPTFPWLLIAIGVSGLLGILMFYNYLEWANDQLIITDRRVVSIQRTLVTFSTRINEIPLDGINEVTVTLPPITDIIGRILGYGTITLRTSGDSNNIRLDEIPNPKVIQEAIFTHRKRYQEARAEENRKAIRGEIAKLVGSGDEGGNPALAGALAGIPTSPGLFNLEYTNEGGETVYRKHWILWFGHILMPSILILGGITLLLVNVVGALIPIVIVLAGAAWFYLADWDWRNDLFVVGDQTITVIHRRPLFLQDQKDQVSLAQVDNVVSDTQGFINSIFQLGEIKILLLGTSEANAKRFSNVYAPQRIQQEISRRKERALLLKQQAEAERQQQAIKDYLAVYHETTATQNPQAAAAPTTYNAPPTTSSAPFGGYVTPPVPEERNEPPQVRDRSRPPGIPRARQDGRPGGS